MSSQCNTYVIIGAKFPYDTFSDDAIRERMEPYYDSAFKGIHHHDGLCVLRDGMNGEYVIIGKVLAKTENHLNFEQIIEIPHDPQAAYEIKTDIVQAFGDAIGSDDFKVGPIVVSHYR